MENKIYITHKTFEYKIFQGWLVWTQIEVNYSTDLQWIAVTKEIQNQKNKR